MQLFDSIKNPSPNIKLCETLKTIPPTSIEAERVFSAVGSFVTKLGARLSDKRPSPIVLELFESSSPQPFYRLELVNTVVERTGKLDVGEFELQLFDSRYMLKGETEEKKCKGWLKPSCIPITIILALIILVVLLPLIGQDEAKSVEVITLGDYDAQFKNCSSPCVITLVESIPENLTFAEGEPTHTSVFESWSQLISLAERSIDIATFYSTLKGQDIQPDDPDPSSWQGDKIFNDLMKAGTDRGIRIRIIQSEPTGSMPDFDTKELEVKGAAKVRSLDFKKMLGNGVLHTKMFLIDKKHFYIGSANMDWRSLTQVKELGIVIYNCSCLALDVNKIFEVYWKLGVPNPYIPPEWPADLQTSINKDNPVTVIMNNSQILTYISSSPPPLCPKGVHQIWIVFLIVLTEPIHLFT
ncbi:5'-3' exonuclease PLD3 [Trichonephila clavipes]|nr:5'-3' exonuclease PLD3 [Trichonephila clavipes]